VVDSKRFDNVSGEGASGEGAGDAELLRRAGELTGRLTTDEKIAMLHQYSPGVPRLGIAPFRTGTEALHGVAWNGPAAVFPQAVGLGATWDPDLVAEVGAAVGAQVRAMHERDRSVSLNVWAPVVNLLRDPRWGRNEEGYSEDPLLTARIAVAYCAGLRGDHPVYWRTAPLLKHFLAYNHETGRDTTSASVRPRVLREYDLPPFLAPIEAGVAVGVMPSYNLVNGRPNHVSPELNRLVRSWSPGELIVCSDAYAPSNLVDTEHYFDDHAVSHAAALRAGLDSFTDQGEDASAAVGRLTEALRRGLITVADVDRAVRRLLLTRLRLGEFDPGLDPYAAPAAPAASAPPAPDALDAGAHLDLARRAAGQAVVLLRNEGGLLPLRPGLRLAVVGPLADMLFEDWYSPTLPYQVTVAAGLTEIFNAASGPAAVVEPGLDRVELRAGPAVLGPFDVFEWGAGPAGDRVVTLRSADTGRYLTVAEDGTVAAEALRPEGWQVHETFVVEEAPASGGRARLRSEVAGRYVTFNQASGTLSAAADAAGAELFSWRVLRDGAEAVARAAAGADVCVVVAGNHPLINGREAQDRTTLALPPGQERLIRAAAGANPATVLVVMSSYPYALGWAAGHVPAIAWTCHGGQETGHGVADVLTGARPPSGRLPQTWYASDADLPGLLDYDIIASGRTYLYFGGQPLYPFGHGLSYTTFAYGALRLEMGRAVLASGGRPPQAPPGSPAVVTVSVAVTNTGSQAGTEMVQVYARAVAPRRPRPRRALAGFARVTLEPGQTETVTVCVPTAALAYWDVAAHRMTVDPGEYEIMAGPSSAVTAAAARLTVTGPPPRPRPGLGTELAAADFDEAENIALVDATRGDGDAVAPAGPGDAWVLLRDTDLGGLGEGGTITLRVAREEAGPARAQLWRRDLEHSDLLAAFTIPSTGSRYTWTNLTAPLTRPEGPPADTVADLCLVLEGPQRVAWLRIDAPQPDGAR
jgi:beta-glucosidase